MEIEEKNIHTFCGKEIFEWKDWDVIDENTLQFYNVKFCFDSMKKYDGMSVIVNVQGQLEIFSENKIGDPVQEWIGWIIDIPGFLKKRTVYKIFHEYDDEFGFHEVEILEICTTEKRADEIIKDYIDLGLDNNEHYYWLIDTLEG